MSLLDLQCSKSLEQETHDEIEQNTRTHTYCVYSHSIDRDQSMNGWKTVAV